MADSPPRASIAEAARTVLWAFFGVRKRVAHERAATRITPLQVAAIALVLVLLFIFTLITIVRFVVGQ
ncbi:MAG: DUF2970 domain-containing protein [Betaproteobacteria bacterium]|nr:DUF2970 domain-containing protein [Betaproteobacteria bacterium]